MPTAGEIFNDRQTILLPPVRQQAPVETTTDMVVGSDLPTMTYAQPASAFDIMGWNHDGVIARAESGPMHGSSATIPAVTTCDFANAIQQAIDMKKER